MSDATPRLIVISLVFFPLIFAIHGTLCAGGFNDHDIESVQLGPRPYSLVNDMDEGPLKEALEDCSEGPFFASDFSIGHRGAPLQFPEHTKESYEAAARMGAGILECDVTFTRDGRLVCRHAECDLHTTTNILETEYSDRCSEFTPAGIDSNGKPVPASFECCTSDLDVDEFLSLCGKMDAPTNPAATVFENYIRETPTWRTDLYSTCGTLMTHEESIQLFRELGVGMTPELKSANPEKLITAFNAGSPEEAQQKYAQRMIDEYKDAGVPARRVWAQSFNLNDVLYWIANERRFGRQAVYLDGRYDDSTFDHTDPSTWSPTMEELVEDGVRIIAPPMWMLLAVENGEIVPSVYANAAKAAGLKIITWTLERSGLLATGGGWYYQTVEELIDNDGDMLTVLDVLARQVGVLGVFSDWAATTTYYANCDVDNDEDEDEDEDEDD
jgi:glycerophosphoryl diester phosphodiesterase